jgi:hypothetical protein
MRAGVVAKEETFWLTALRRIEPIPSRPAEVTDLANALRPQARLAISAVPMGFLSFHLVYHGVLHRLTLMLGRRCG